LNLILSEGGLGIDKNELLRIYKEATAEKFSPLIIDYEAEPDKRYRKGFDEFISVTPSQEA
jgi:predicted Ser/Thr protein kinase